MKSTRRSFTEEFRQRVVAETEQPGASIAGIALAHGINANVVHKWRSRLLERRRRPAEDIGLLPIAVMPEPEAVRTTIAAATEAAGTLKIELPRARIEIVGAVDLDALQTVLAALRSR